LDISLGDGRAVLVDEVIEESIHLPGGSGSIVSNGHTRTEAPEEASGGSAYATRASDGDAIVIVVPIDGMPLAVRTRTAGEFRIDANEAQVVESSHTITQSAVNEKTFQYYEYAAPASLEWSAQGETTLQAKGDFELYMWGVPFSLRTHDGTTERVTGYQSEPDSTTGGLTTNDHHRYARLLVHNGTLDLSTPGGLVALFASSIDAQPADVTFQSTDGTAPVQGGSFTADGGPVTATSGDYHLSYKPGGMDIDVTQAPMHASGPYVQFTPTPWHRQPWFLPTLGASIALVGLTVSAYAYPTVYGTRHLRYMESLTGKPRAVGWRKSRAEGYALMAAAAEDGGHMRRAVLWMALASMLDPHDPTKRLDLGIFQASRGHPRVALRHFAAAHKGFLEAGDNDDMAHNAYEAARAACLVHDQDQAIDWLRIAVQADPAVAGLIGLDPAFASLRETDDYAALTRA
jgi:hypothetical protein